MMKKNFKNKIELHNGVVELQIFPTKIQPQIHTLLITASIKILSKTITMKIIWNSKNKYLKEICSKIYTQEMIKRNSGMNNLSLKIFTIPGQTQLSTCLHHKNQSLQKRYKTTTYFLTTLKNSNKMLRTSTKTILDPLQIIYLLLLVKLLNKN